MARGSVRRLPNGKYQARYRPEGSPNQIARNFDLKRDAQRFLDEVNASVLTGRYVDPKSQKILVKTYAAMWRQAQRHRLNTAKRHNTIFTAHILPKFGDRPIGSILPTEVQAWVTDMSRTLKPGTVRVVFTPFKSMMAAAVRDKIIAESPAVGIKLPEQKNGLIVPMSPEQVALTRENMPDHLKALVVVMAGTGLRPGEAAGMTVDKIDFLRRVYHVDQQLMMTRPHHLAELKTAASYRPIPLTDTVLNALSVHIATYGVGPEGLVFRTRKNGMLNKDAFQTAFRNALNAAGMPGRRAHDLRHFYASVLIHAGINFKVVQTLMGHATSKETLDTYAHMFPNTEEATRAAVENVIGPMLEEGDETQEGAGG